MDQVLLIRIVLLSASIMYVSSERFHIVTSHSSPCPSEITGEPCLTLKQFVAHSWSNMISNITLTLESGNHSLSGSRSTLRFNNLVMTAVSANIIFTSQETYLELENIQYVKLSGITFHNVIISVSSTRELKVQECNFQAVRFSVIDVSKADFSRCTFTGNYRQGSIHYLTFYSILSQSVAVIDQCIFSNNTIIYYNIYESYGVQNHTLTISESTFANNTSNYGAGVIDIQIISYTYYFYYRDANFHLTVNITDSTFTNNTAQYGEGGALSVNGDNVQLLVHQCNFIKNTANKASAGAIYLNGKYYSSYTLTENTFKDNSANLCGALTIKNNYDSITTVVNNTFYSNKAKSVVDIGGGAICVQNARALISSCTFNGNNAKVDGGAIVMDNSTVTIVDTNFNNNTAGRDGGALNTNIYPSNYSIINCSFEYNEAGDDGGAVHIGRKGSHITMDGCSFVNNHALDRGGAITIFGSVFEISHNHFHGNNAELGENNISSCNSSIMSSIPYHEEINCFSFSDDVNNITIKVSDYPSYCNSYWNVSLNISINKLCIEYLPTNEELHSSELNNIIAASYTSLSFSTIFIFCLLFYMTTIVFRRYYGRCNREEQRVNGDTSQPLYDEENERANTEHFEMEPNVLYGRHPPHVQ